MPGFFYEPIKNRSVEWFTPPRIFKALGLHFHMDVASPPASEVTWVPANRFLTEADDGLSVPWEHRVWCNPPYTKHVARWIEKLQAHGDGLIMLPARTDTQWFQHYAPLAAGVCFISGRVQFLPGENQRVAGAGVSEILFSYGPTCTIALLNSNLGTTFANHLFEGTPT